MASEPNGARKSRLSLRLRLSRPFRLDPSRMPWYAKGAKPAHPFFQTLHELLLEDGTVTLGELLDAAGEQTYGLLVLLLGITSFIPGISIAGGLGLLVLGLQMAWGVPHPWLPKKLRGMGLHKGKIKEALAAFERQLERFTKRGEQRRPLNQRWVGALIAWTAFLLAIPVPPILPLGNMLPAAAICLMGAALLEERPGWAWMGALGSLLTTGYFAFSFELVLRTILRMFH